VDVIAKQRDMIAGALKAAADRCAAEGLLQVGPVQEVHLETPRSKEHGHLATNLALVLSSEAGLPPRKVAELLVDKLDLKKAAIERVEIAGPGFINFHLSQDWWGRLLAEILAGGSRYGCKRTDRPRKIQLEFVSANPTGPMNVVNARAAAVGDCLARLLAAVGEDVSKEFYVNDAGSQADQFARSLEARFRQLCGEEAEIPPDGYPGEYVLEVAKELFDEHPELVEMSPEERIGFFRRQGLDRMVEWQRRDLEAFGVTFDVWFRERDLHATGRVEAVVRELQQGGHIYEKDGALWFRSTAYGDDKDRVLVRSDGQPTYLAADIAYHRDKYERGFDRVIDIWGPDHHGYIARMKAAVQALGRDEEDLEVIILQLVNLLRGGQQVRMSKRTGTFIGMAELVEEVGRDAARFFFLMRSPESHLDFDLDLAQEQTADNPVYYVQYAHARICSILRQAEEKGIALPEPGDIDATLLATGHEEELLKCLAAFPGEVEAAALRREPHRIAHYVHELASLFHSFYTHCRVIGEEEELQAARLTLVRGVRIVLANALELLGVSAPEIM
jgi:arginyl-tRNA synthetase